MITVSGPVRVQLVARIHEARRARDIIASLERELEVATNLHSDLDAVLGFRERYLGGAFGGDKQKAQRFRGLGESMERLASSCSEQQAVLHRAEEEISQMLDEVLMGGDPAYASLRAMHEDGKAAKEACGYLVALLVRATEEVDDAQMANTLDAVGVNGMAGFDYLATQEARDAIQEINQYIPAYQEVIGRFLGAQGAGADIHNLDEFLAQLDITDLVVEFGIGDFFQIEELESCEAALRSHLKKARKTAVQIDAILKPLGKRRQAAQAELQATLT